MDVLRSHCRQCWSDFWKKSNGRNFPVRTPTTVPTTDICAQFEEGRDATRTQTRSPAGAGGQHQPGVGGGSAEGAAGLQHAEDLLSMLGLTEGSVGRFRDAFVLPDRIAVYTRNGGGNREHYGNAEYESEDPPADGSCRCTGCIITVHLPQHPLYIRDEDDGFDSTYATVYFKFPPEYADILGEAGKGQEWKPDEKWAAAIEGLKGRQL